MIASRTRIGLLIGFALLPFAAACEAHSPPFVRGDCNADGVVDVVDAIAAINAIFVGPLPSCVDVCDANADLTVDVADPIFLLSYVFGFGAPTLPPPFPACESVEDFIRCPMGFPLCPLGPIPTDLEIIAGSDQWGATNQVLPDELVVLATDDQGAPVEFVDVSFTVATGGGQIVGSSHGDTDANGLVRARWRLGGSTGVQTVIAEVVGLGSVVFRATATPSRQQEPTLEGSDAPAVYTHGHVVLGTGEVRLDRCDLSVPGRGDIRFRLARRYRSQLGHAGVLGPGWDLNYDERLIIEENGDVLRRDGAGHIDRWIREPSGTFVSPRGYFGELIARPDGTYQLRESSGFRRIYDESGRLVRHRDRHGNEMLLNRDALGRLTEIYDAYGRAYQFFIETLPSGHARLTRVVDFTGREVRYSYDSEGRLVSARTPVVVGSTTGNDFPNGRTEVYAYDVTFDVAAAADPALASNLISVTFPREAAGAGPPALAWTYGIDPLNATTYDRALTESEGGTNATGVAAGGTSTFSYVSVNVGAAPGQLQLPRWVVHVTDRAGNEFEASHNEVGHAILLQEFTRGLRPAEPLLYETRSFYDLDGQLLRRVFPEANELVITYDASGARRAQRNRLEIRLVAGPRGGGEDIVHNLTYEPLYQQPLTHVDPRGNATQFVPPIGAASAARYTTTWSYDYQEGVGPVAEAVEFGIDLTGVPRGLGDLNGDGHLAADYGDRVRCQRPTVWLRPDSQQALQSASTQQLILEEFQWNDRGQRVRTIDAEGNVTRYDYHPDNDPDGDGVATPPGPIATTPAPYGYLRSVTDDAETSPRRTAPVPPLGLETSFELDSAGNVVAILNPRGVRTEFEVNALNETLRVIRGADTTVANGTGQLIPPEPPLAYQTHYHYDANGCLIRIDDENRGQPTPGVGDFVSQMFRYDILDQLIEHSVEVDAATTAVSARRYDACENLTRLIRPEGNQVAFEYDERNLVLRMTRGFSSPDASTCQFDYDLNGNLARFLDAEDQDGDGLGEATVTTYNGFDRVIAVADPLGNERRYEYDVALDVVRVLISGHPADAPGAPNTDLRDTRFAYDESHRLFRVDELLFMPQGSNPALPVSLLDHDGDGLVTSYQEFDALSRRTFWTEDDLATHALVYDGADRVVEHLDPGGNRELREHDPNSNLVRVTRIDTATAGVVVDEEFQGARSFDQLDRLIGVSGNRTARFAYDSRDLLVAISDAQGTVMLDPLQQVTPEINGPGNTTTYVHDGRGLCIEMSADLRVGGVGEAPLDLSNPFNTDGRITESFDYDRNARLTGFTDDNGNQSQWNYDALDRLREVTRADGTVYSCAYDRDDNLVARVDPNGSAITTDYDVLNRPIFESVVRGAGVGGTTELSFGYDGLGRLVRSTDDNGSPSTTHGVTHVWDSLGRPVETAIDSRTLATTWSGDGKVVGCRYSGGRDVWLTHDELDRTLAITEGGATLMTYEWLGPGVERPLQREHGNGTSLTYKNIAGTLASGYDEFARVQQLRHLDGSGGEVVWRTYRYDREHHMTEERRWDDAGRSDRYQYDSSYRLDRVEYDLGAAGLVRDLLQAEYRWDGVGNRREVDEVRTSTGASTVSYMTNTTNAYTGVGPSPRIYDANGNLLGDGARNYTYDYQNRLIAARRASDGALLGEYQYEAAGQRVRRKVYDPNQPGSVRRDVAYTYDGEGRLVEEIGPQGLEVSYVYGDHERTPVQMVRTSLHPAGAGQYYLHENARGDVVAVTDDNQGVVERVVYGDFGEPTRLLSIQNEVLFRGYRYDDELGLYYGDGRHYDPLAGRFLQRGADPDMGSHGNPYTLAGNSPLMASASSMASTVSGLRSPDAYTPGITVGEWFGGFWSSLTEDSWAAHSYNNEAAYIEKVAELYVDDGNGMGMVALLTTATLISDAFGGTEVYEAGSGNDLVTLVHTGNYRELSGKERVVKGIAGGLKVVGTAFQVSSAARGLTGYTVRTVSQLEARAAAQATSQGVSSTATRGVLAGHGEVTGNVFRLPRNVSVRVHCKYGDELMDAVGNRVDRLAGVGPDVRVFKGGDLIPEHILSAGPELNIARNMPWVREVLTDTKLSTLVEQIAAKNPGAEVLIEWSACRVGPGQGLGQVLYIHATRALGPSGLAMGEAYSVASYQVRIQEDGEIIVEDDAFGVPPGIESELCTAANDGTLPTDTYELVTAPSLHPDLFTWAPDGSFAIAPLTTVTQVTFTYRVVRDGQPSETKTVTVEVQPSDLYTDLPTSVDPMTGEAMVTVPCLLLGGAHYPIYQFRLTNNPADVCTPPHWHAFGAVFPLEFPNSGIVDPNPPSCGFGTFSAVPREDFTISDSAWQDFLIQHIPPI
ncbi:MAG: DUF6531 domain-containing protein [Planctomycetota bacterium]